MLLLRLLQLCFTVLSIAAFVVHSQQTIGYAAQTDFYVAMDGDDANPGTISQPFRSLSAALTAIEELKRSGPLTPGQLTIFIREGSYRVLDSFQLDARHSGQVDCPIVIRAFDDEQVQFCGGTAIPPSAFKPLADPSVRDRIIAESARDSVQEANLLEEGIPLAWIGRRERTGLHLPVTPAPTELFFDDRRMTVARWPNHGYEMIDEVVRAGSAPAFHTPQSSHHGVRTGPAYMPGVFRYRGERPSLWLNAREVWLEAYWVYDWADDCMLIAHIDPSQHEITMSAPHAYGMGGELGGGDRFFVLNLLEEIDQAGEYYLDPYSGVLYFYPPEDLDAQSITISVLSTPFLTLTNVSHISIEGITFEVARGDGLTIVGGRDNSIRGCTFRNLGGWAVKVQGGSGHSVESCDIYDVGRGGIELVGGDQRTLTPSDHRAINNHIHHFSRLAKTYQWAIGLRGVGNIASNNLIHDSPHGAIDWRGNHNIIELNEIRHVAMDTNDAGAIQTDRDFSICGNVIRHNFIHHIGGAASEGNVLGVFMVYLDSAASGDTFTGNVFFRGGDRNMIFINGGRDVTVENNIFVDGGHPVELTSNGLTYHRHTLEIAWQAMLSKVDHKSPPWSEVFPKLAQYPDNYDELGIPRGNRIAHNVFYRTKNIAFSFDDSVSKDIVHVTGNWAASEDPFVDIANHDFRFREQAAIEQKIPAFQPIPFGRIGLYRDAFRSTLPE
ncbi:MAG TPA: right-handed parallel beta-helix repeat-containing protein [Lacipirellulaceae bacterium]|nr:right-handed parallel beta-helix repeat-containing protein [Lacipirellulaceae bacterium]